MLKFILWVAIAVWMMAFTVVVIGYLLTIT